MKTLVVHSVFFALIGLMLSPLVAHASSSSADNVQKCAPFDYEQWRRDNPRPAGKALAALNRGEPRTVRMIYFLPNNRPYRAAAVDTMKLRMRQVQDFFAEQMRVNGQGNTTIRFEADASGEPLVLRVDGQHPTRYYNTDRTVDKVLDEIDPSFDMEANVYYIAIDNGNYVIYNGDELVGGVGSRWEKDGGWGMVPIRADFGTVAHELGHAFGLSHDFRDDNYVMSYGYIADWAWADHWLSACNAEFLAVHPYFNANIPVEAGSWPTFGERTSSPIQTAGHNQHPVRTKVRDPDELHQAILFTVTQAPHFAEGSFEVKACRGLEGRRNPVVEFVYDGRAPSQPESDFNSFETQELVIGVVDALGDDGYSEVFELVNNEFRRPISTVSFDRWLSPVVFSSDGRLLALESSFEDDKVTLLDATTGTAGTAIATLPPWAPVEVWALSPDGRLLALEVPNHTIVLWDIASSTQHVATAPAHQQDEDFPDNPVVSSLAFSPDGRLLASGGIRDFKLWDVASGKHVATVASFSTGDFSGSISSLAFSPDGELLAAYDAWGTVTLWNMANRNRVAEIDAHEGGSWGHSWGQSNDLAFSPDGKLLATGGTRVTKGTIWEPEEEEAEVTLWNVASRQPVATLYGSAPVSFSSDGRLLASASPRKRIWLDTDGLEGGGRSARLYGDGGGVVKLWDVSTGEPFAALSPWARVGTVVFSSDGLLLAEQSGEKVHWTVRQWDVSEWIGEQATTPVEPARPQTLTKVSGEGQRGLVGTALTAPFVVSVLDQNGSAFAGAVVTFSVTAGGGTLSSTTVTTDANGRAATTLTLGSEPGANTVAATVAGLETVTFTATATATATASGQTPHSLTKVSGEGQRGLVGTALTAPFVVFVLDQNGSAFAGAVVTFSVTAGGGALSSTTVTTDANGRARSTLTLGSDPGTNTVAATVAGLEPVTFTATATEQTPHSLTKVSGEGQGGPASTQLAAPFVVSVLDQDGSPLAGVGVTFSVTAGGGLLSSTTNAHPCTVESSTSSATATTDANGQAATRLTLGSDAETNTVAATVEGLASVTFTATAAEQAMPHRLTKVCGDSQEGTAGILLDEPFVVSVLDENSAAMAGVVVSFSVTAGGGTLSAAMAPTNANGLASAWLTLGSDAGTNTVAATVEGLRTVTFTAIGQADPLASLFDLFNQSGKRVALPDRTHLLPNAPNPFNSQTVLSYFLLKPSPVRLEVFALSGQRVAVLHQGSQQAGYHRLHWDGRDAAGHPVASGAYLYRLATDEAVLTRKLILLR